MPDIFALFRTFWQHLAKPCLQRMSFRVNKRGITSLLAWFILVFVYSLVDILTLHPLMSGLAWLANIFAVLAIVVTVVIWLAIIVDYVYLWRATQIDEHSLINGLHIERQLNNNLSVQSWTEVSLILRHLEPNPKNIQLNIMDNYPILAESRLLPITVTAENLTVSPTTHGNYQDGCIITYEMLPKERGEAEFFGVDILLSSPIGLLSKFVHINEQRIQGVKNVRILANFIDLIEGQLLGISQKTAASGLIKQRKKGQGQDFHQIRNYSEGDSIRHLDWKATSRYQRLMSKEYQDEKDQQIMFLLDCGQQMRHTRFFDKALAFDHDNKQTQASHLDQALNAMLLLADVAKEQGDAIGFINFASKQNKIVPPKKGQQVTSYLLNQSFDIKPSMLSPDYIAAARTLRNMQKKRCLVILITNTRQEEYSELIEAIQLLSAKHLVIFANLYEQDLQDYLGILPNDSDEALTYHTIQEYLNMRETLHQSLAEQARVFTIHCTPNELPTKLVQTYLAVKHKYHLN